MHFRPALLLCVLASASVVGACGDAGRPPGVVGNDAGTTSLIDGEILRYDAGPDAGHDGGDAGCPLGSICMPNTMMTVSHPPLNMMGLPEWNLNSMNSTPGVVVDSMDPTRLTLEPQTGGANYFVWVANATESTVSKIDATTGREVARYVAGLVGPSTGVQESYPVINTCDWSSTGNCPSRTAVDQQYNAYVANRAFGRQGTVTKFAGPIENCVDRNGNMMIETSSDVNGDGRIDRNNPAEFLGQADECILWTADVGGVNHVPRALAVGLKHGAAVGDVWVGLFNTAKACRLNPMTGATIGCYNIGLAPYGAVADAYGKIWFARRGGTGTNIIVSIDDTSLSVNWPVTPLPSGCKTSYGIAYGQDMIGVAANCNTTDPSGYNVALYDLIGNTWTLITTPTNGITRGIAFSQYQMVVAESNDFSSGGWGGGTTPGRLHLYARNAMTGAYDYQQELALHDLDEAPVGTCKTTSGLWSAGNPTNPGNCGTAPIGVGFDYDGNLWAAASNSRALKVQIDPMTLAPTVVYGKANAGSGVYCYSDFTGGGLLLAEPQGTYTFTLEGCTTQLTRWLTFQLEVDIPAGARVRLKFKSATSTADFATMPWIDGPDWLGPVSGTQSVDLAMLGVPTRKHLQVEVAFVRDAISGLAPSVGDFLVNRECLDPST